MGDRKNGGGVRVDGLTRIMKGPEINGSEVMKYIKKQTEREV